MGRGPALAVRDVPQRAQETTAGQDGEGKGGEVVDEAPAEAVPVTEGQGEKARPAWAPQAAQEKAQAERQSSHHHGEEEAVCELERQQPVEERDQVVVAEVGRELP